MPRLNSDTFRREQTRHREAELDRSRNHDGTSISPPSPSHLLRAETAHLANECFRDLVGLGADDSFGDTAIAPVRCALAPCRTIGIARAVRMGAGARGCLCPAAAARDGSVGFQAVAASHHKGGVSSLRTT
jgi:hypothetical protein